jgi:hypothetical protein
MILTLCRSPAGFGVALGYARRALSPSYELPLVVLNTDAEPGQRGRVLPVVMRAEQQFPSTAEQDPNVPLEPGTLARRLRMAGFAVASVRVGADRVRFAATLQRS